MEKSLAKNNLFGIKKTTLQTVISTANIDFAVTQNNNYLTEKTLLKAEREKAEAIQILRCSTFIR